MEIKNQIKPVEATVNFKRPLSCQEIIELVSKAIEECNIILEENRQNMPFFKRIFTKPDAYHLCYDAHMYYSYDGKTPMKLGGPFLLNREEFPDNEYEIRYLISIIGVRDIHLYFNVIPGIAKDDQFGTMISEKELVSCITIKANLKSKPYWKRRQEKFLQLLIPIIKILNIETK